LISIHYQTDIYQNYIIQAINLYLNEHTFFDKLDGLLSKYFQVEKYNFLNIIISKVIREHSKLI